MNRQIIFVPYMTGYGGTETVIKNLLDYDKKISLYSIGGTLNDKWINKAQSEIVWISKYKLIRMLYYSTIMPFILLKKVLEWKPEVVISTNSIMWTILFLIKTLLRKKYVVLAWYHYSINMKPIRFFMLNKNDGFLSISDEGTEELINLGISTDKIKTVYNPILPSDIITKKSCNHNQFIYIGRVELYNQKNMHELFDALKLLEQPWHLRIFGQGTDRDMKIVKKYTSELGIDSNITWEGFVKNPWSSMGEVDALIMTSKYEGLPMVLIEAISHGIFVISSDCRSGPKEIINDKNGKLYHLGNVDQLRLDLKDVVNDAIKVNQESAKKTVSRFFVSNYVENFKKAIDYFIER